MAKEYIEREAAIDELTERNLVAHMDSVNDGLVASCHRSAQRILACLPAADVRPVVRGRWNRTDAYPHRLYCSACYKTYLKNDELLERLEVPLNFCPNCGADMREES